MSSRKLCNFFFVALHGGTYKCSKCSITRKQQPGSCWSNLMSHLLGKHPQFRDEYAEFSLTGTTLADYGFLDDRNYEWMSWVIERNHPLREVEQASTRRLARINPVSTKTLKKYMQHVAAKDGKLLAVGMGAACGLMFDGWTCNSTHFDAVYAVYTVGERRRESLLGISLMEHGQSAEAHVQFLESIFDVYGKTPSQVLFLVGDSCSTNQCYATKLGVPLIGCASHRFNLAVSKFIADHQSIVDEVQALCIELRQPEQLRCARAPHPSGPLKANTTRWSPTLNMRRRYVEIRDAIKRVTQSRIGFLAPTFIARS